MTTTPSIQIDHESPSSPTYINHNLIVAHQKQLHDQQGYSNINNYSSLLCHQAAGTSSPPAIKKRDKLRYRLSDVGTWGRRKKDKFNRRFHSMNETIELLADPVIEDNSMVSDVSHLFDQFCFSFD